MIDGYGTVSFLEGMRLVLALTGLGASLWAIAHARDGSLAFPTPIRKRMVWRRRAQMLGFLAIIGIWATQTLSAALVPDPAVISPAGTAVSYAVIATLGILLAMTLMFSIGWAGVQEIVGTTPLQPDTEERLIEATAAGRELGHIARNQLGIIASTFDVLLADPTISPQSRADIERALQSVEAVTVHVQALHDQVRALAPPAEGS